eukprot:TRINITY_DN2835_c0_g1_i5.p1 TRINITY_DN2835_c0_g1~~TRINITY_DN2835_c0_g1_i5.p1  ORF type:complete len:426 (-),score=75.93 TRINITY_DN2835_c0_g1_i5:192-1469(-)
MLLKMAQAEANNCSIDKSKFERTINLKALRIPTQRCSTLMKRLRQFTLKRSKVRQVVVPLENNNDTRLILLDEQISQKDSMQDDGLLELLDGESFEVCGYELKLGYEHLNVKEVLEQVLPAGVEVPVAFETVGHIAHLNLTPQQMPFKHQIGQTLLDKNPTISTVVTKVGSIENEFRVFDMEVIAGENRLETEVVQYGTKFKLDFQKVYWNSRLEQEHKRVVGLLRSSEVIVDMMAGIGPFAIPAARKGCKVYANDLNPDSYRYLEINKKLNKIQEDRLQLFNMDARPFMRFLCGCGNEQIDGDGESNKNSPAFEFHHVIMNLPASAVEFLDVFSGLFDDQRYNQDTKMPTIHVYTFHKGEQESEIVEQVEQRLGGKLEEYVIHKVRDVAPNKLMFCVSFQLPSEVAFNRQQRPAKRPKLDTKYT